MNRDVSIKGFFGKDQCFTLNTSNKGLHVLNKSDEFYSDSSCVNSFLSNCIDLDEWKHSWHLDVSKAQSKGSEERKKITKIFDDKIKKREEEIKLLKNAKNTLRFWKY